MKTITKSLKYKSYSIQPKLDFGDVGFYIRGEYIKKGWLVVKDGCNVVEGAGWFFTIREAKQWINQQPRPSKKMDVFIWQKQLGIIK